MNVFKMISEIPFISIILEMSITASIMIFVVVAILRLFSRKMSSTVMLLLWIMVLVRLYLPFTFTSPIQLVDLMPEKAEVILQSVDKMPDYVNHDMSENGMTRQISQYGIDEENLQINAVNDTSAVEKQNKQNNEK